jgi:hypothetical protein
MFMYCFVTLFSEDFLSKPSTLDFPVILDGQSSGYIRDYETSNF